MIEKVLADVFTRHSDRRLDLFKVTVEEVGGGEVKLAGRVLLPESLEEVKRGVGAVAPGVRVDVGGVKVLRARAGVMYTVATTLTDLHVEPSFLSEMLTQVMNGVGLEVLEESADGKWVFVRQVDGYLGWAYKPYLSEGAPAGGETHVVVGNAAQLCKEAGAWPVSRLMCGTFVKVVGEKDGWSRVELGGKMTAEGGWVPSLALRDVGKFPLPAGEARMQVVHDARTMLGVYYLWGGGSPFGIDCSGLAQLCHRLSGYTLPRDADMQFRAGRVVEGPAEAGDLVFFHSEKSKEKITHVGISTGGGRIIHSSRSRNGVYEEEVGANENLRNFVAGARTFLG
jgi:hypothetical protein